MSEPASEWTSKWPIFGCYEPLCAITGLAGDDAVFGGFPAAETLIEILSEDAAGGGRVGGVSEDVDAVLGVHADALHLVAAVEDGVGLLKVGPAVVAIQDADCERGGGA